MDTMEYKGYFSTPWYSADDDLYWGKLEGIRDSISFEGETLDALQTAFLEAVEDYLDTCRRNGMTPKKPFASRLALQTV